MRIRTQNLVAIVPLFLAMAVWVGAMTYATGRQEVLWGLDEEASSLSVAIAEFVSGGPVTSARLESLRPAFERVLAHGQAERIFVQRASGELLWSVGAERAAGLAVSAAQREALAGGAHAAVGEVVELPGGEAVMLSVSPLRDEADQVVGSLGVVIDASRLAALTRQILGGLARLTLLALVIGTFAALFISSLLTRKVKALSRAALEVAGGEYDRHIQVGTIQEVSDLSNTFNTLSSVLRDLVERTRRTLIEGEQFRTPLDLARTYRQDTWSDLGGAYAGVQVASRAIGGGHPGDVYGVVEQHGVVTVFVGRVGASNEVDAAIAATAARRALEEGARHWPLPQVVDEVCRLLRMRLETVSWRHGDEAEGLLTTYGGDGAPRTAPLRLDEEQTVLLHTFPGRAGDTLRRWKRVFQQMSPDALIDNLGRTTESGAMGTLVAVGREPVAAERAVS